MQQIIGIVSVSVLGLVFSFVIVWILWSGLFKKLAESLGERPLSVHKQHEFLLKMEKAGLNEKLMQEIIESKNNTVAIKMMDIACSFLAVERLKNLTLIADVPVKTNLFIRDLLLFSEGSVKVSFYEDFIGKVFRQVPYKINPFNGRLRRTRLTKDMRDCEILKELGDPKPFSVSEFAAIIYDLLSRQQNEGGKDLLGDGMGNIFYIELKDGTMLSLLVDWKAGWHIDAFDVDFKSDKHWVEGTDIFSRSPDVIV